MHRTERVKKGFPKYFLQIHCFQKSTAVNKMIVGSSDPLTLSSEAVII